MERGIGEMDGSNPQDLVAPLMRGKATQLLVVFRRQPQEYATAAGGDGLVEH